VAEITLVGLNHTLAPVEVRERLAFGGERLPEALAALQCGLVQGTAGMAAKRPKRLSFLPATAQSSTCTARAEPRRSRVTSWLLTALFPRRTRRLAVRIVLRERNAPPLAGGRRSGFARRRRKRDPGPGEGRVRGAQAAGTAGPVLAALFRHAARAGKRVRTETELGRASLSVATLVVEMAEELFGPLAHRTALLIGAGKMAALQDRRSCAPGCAACWSPTAHSTVPSA